MDGEWPYFKRCTSQIQFLSIDEIKSTGYVIDSLEAAIYCFLTTDSFEASVLKAVNLGDDTDTVGAITGGLSGTYYGEEGIPHTLLDGLLKRVDIAKLIDEFICGLPYAAKIIES